MALSVRLLRIFRSVAKTGGVAAAARHLNLSAPSVSQAIADLESLIGQPLFDRAGRRLKMNSVGAALLPRTEGVLNDIDGIERDLRRQRVRIEIGASVTAGNHILPAVLMELFRLYPEYDVSVMIRNTQAIADAVERHEVAIAIIEGHISREALIVHRWRHDDLVLVAPPDHGLAGRLLNAQDLEGATWVLRENGSGTRETFESAVGGHFVPKRIAFTVGGNELLKAAVLGGVGLGCISEEAVKTELEAGSLAVLRAPWLKMRRDLSVVIHARQILDAPVKAMLQICGQTASEGYQAAFSAWT